MRAVDAAAEPPCEVAVATAARLAGGGGAGNQKEKTKGGPGRGAPPRHKKVGADKGSNVNVRRSTSYPPGPERNRSKTSRAEQDDGPADPEAGRENLPFL